MLYCLRQQFVASNETARVIFYKSGVYLMRKWLKQLRVDHDKSQQDIATVLGITRQAYAFIENGKRQKDMGISIAVKIADFFEISLSTIRDYEEARIISESVRIKKK